MRIECGYIDDGWVSSQVSTLHMSHHAASVPRRVLTCGAAVFDGQGFTVDVLIIGAGLIYFSAFTLFNIVVKKKRGKEALPHRAPLGCFGNDIRYYLVVCCWSGAVHRLACWPPLDEAVLMAIIRCAVLLRRRG
jgi:hypothetical protein